MVKTKQFNSLSFIFLFNQLQSITLECFFARFLPVLKQNACIIAVKIIVNKSITAVLHLNLEIPYILSDLCCILMDVQHEIR